MKPEYYQKLASKWLNGTITEEEKIIFSDWYANSVGEELEIPNHIADNENDIKHRLYQKIQSNIESKNGYHANKSYSLKKYIQIAAAILLISFAGLTYYKSNDRFTPKQKLVQADIQPGRRHAILTLSDGSTVNVDSIQIGQIIEDEGLRITKNKHGEILYLSSALANANLNDLHKITTPKGSEIQFLLPDGSKVWLNANSSIQYALNFIGNKREIELLQGEAFFEVKKLKIFDRSIPFIVNSDHQSIEVLGTSFNISLDDKNVIRTTLVEGSVRLARKNQLQSVILKPGQQSALFNSSNDFEVREVNVAQFIAWKNGLFYFDDTNLETLLQQISQWYDIEIDYNKTADQYHFVGKIPRSTSLDTILAILKSAGVKLHLEGRKLFVNQ